MGIFEPKKSPVQKMKFYGESCDVIDIISKTFVREIIGYWMRYL